MKVDSYLTHEARNDPMECRTSVTVSVLSGAQRPEVLRGLWNNVGTELHHYPTDGLSDHSKIIRARL